MNFLIIHYYPFSGITCYFFLVVYSFYHSLHEFYVDDFDEEV